MTAAAVASPPAMKVRPPCVTCGTTGGTPGPGGKAPTRTRGMCTVCYSRYRHREVAAGRFTPIRPPVKLPCVSCGTPGGAVKSGERFPARTRGLCCACYGRHLRFLKRVDTGERPTPALKVKPPCVVCGDHAGKINTGDRTPFRARGMCLRCYRRRRTAEGKRRVEVEPCARCGDPGGRPHSRAVIQDRPRRVHGLCDVCYGKERRAKFAARRAARREAEAIEAAGSDRKREDSERVQVAARILALRPRPLPDEYRLPVVCPTCARPPTFGPSSRTVARESVAIYRGAAKRLRLGRGPTRRDPIAPREPHYYGVIKDRRGEKRLPYWGQLYIGDRRYWTRYFLTAVQAARAVDDLIRLHGGDLSRLNFPAAGVAETHSPPTFATGA